VFQADLKLDATFDLAGVPTAGSARREIGLEPCRDCSGSERRSRSAGRGRINNERKELDAGPGGNCREHLLGGDQAQHIKLTLFGAKAEDIASPNKQFNVSTALRFSGAQRIAVLAYGKTTHRSIQGDWPVQDSMEDSCQ